jgi:hypothetical protein
LTKILLENSYFSPAQPYTTWYSATIVYTGLQEKSQIRHAPIISEQWKIYSNKSLVYTGEVYTYTIGTTIVNSTLSNSRIPCGPNMCDLVLLGNTRAPTVINPNPTVTDTLGNSDISHESNIRDPGFSENTSVSSIPGTIEPINTPLPITDNPIQVDHLNTPEIVIAGTPIPTDDSVPTPTIDYTQMVTVGGYAKINDMPQDTDVNKKQDTVVEKDIVEKIKALCTNILSWVGDNRIT